MAIDRTDSNNAVDDTTHSDNDPFKYRDREWLYDQYIVQDKTEYEIADGVRASQATISNWLSKHNIKTVEREVGDVQKLRDGEWLHEKYVEEELSIPNIANILDVSTSTVSRWLRKQSIPTRPR